MFQAPPILSHSLIRPRASRNRKETRNGGFTLLELMLLILLLVVISSFLYGAIQNARKRSDQFHCVANLKQISVASLAYGADHHGDWPDNRVVDKVKEPNMDNVVFLESLLPYVGPIPKKPSAGMSRSAFRNSPFVCPAERLNEPNGSYVYQGVATVRSRGLSYGQNYYLQQTASKSRVGPRNAVQYPSELVLYMDFQGHYLMDYSRLIQGDRIELTEKRHGRMVNAAFADGSIRSVDIRTIPSQLPCRFWQGRE